MASSAPPLRPAELLARGQLALRRRRPVTARQAFLEACGAVEPLVSASSLRQLARVRGEEGDWRGALDLARCAERAAELAIELVRAVPGCRSAAAGAEAVGERIHARLVQVEALLHRGELGMARELLDASYALARGLEDPVLLASLWWTVANVARSHGRWSLVALALSRSLEQPGLFDEDRAELQLSFAEACLEAGRADDGAAALAALDDVSLPAPSMARVLGVRGALTLEGEPEAAWTMWARADALLEQTGAWQHLALLRSCNSRLDYHPRMSSIDLDAAEKFFSQFAELEAETWTFQLQDEVDWFAGAMQERKLVPFFEDLPGNMIETLVRPDPVTPEWLSQHRGRAVGVRTLFALQPVRCDGKPTVFAYCDGFEKLGLGMNERFAVRQADGGLKMVSRQTLCGECGGSGCGTCGQQGWRHARGKRLGKPTGDGPARKLTAPDEAKSKALYDALT